MMKLFCFLPTEDDLSIGIETCLQFHRDLATEIARVAR